MHWSLFIFFIHDNGRDGILDLFLSERYLNAIQMNAHHLLRYLATTAIVNKRVNKRRRNVLKELIKVIQQERYTYNDPVTEFLECLYVNYNYFSCSLVRTAADCERLFLGQAMIRQWFCDLSIGQAIIRQ